MTADQPSPAPPVPTPDRAGPGPGPAGSNLDPERLKHFQARTFGQLQGALTAAMVCLGDRLGLYRALADAGRPLTTAELADATGLTERWVREWAGNQGAAGLLEVASVTTAPEGLLQVAITPEAVVVLADEGSDVFGAGEFAQLPSMFAALDDIAESFRTGIGYPYDHLGESAADSSERGFEIWHRHHLVPEVIGALDGVSERLAAGGRAADVGCGAGGAVLLLAAAFPASTVTGYDISKVALARAEERRIEQQLANAAFVDAAHQQLPADGSLDLVTTFDCLHDMTDPAAIAAAIRRAVRPDGVWLIAEIKAQESFEQNVAKNPMTAMMYGISVLSCMSSALSEPGGAGLGTLGLSESRVRQLVTTAGFTQFCRLPVKHAVNYFYEVKP